MSAPLPGDKRAGYMGLIFGAIAVGAILWGISHLTNRKFDAHEAAAAQHGQQQGGQGH